MKITKILVALAFLVRVSTANAGEITVTGSMEATYHTESETTTGNPIGMDRELKFAGSTELDNGLQFLCSRYIDSLAFGNTHRVRNIAGMQQFTLVLTKIQSMQSMTLHLQLMKKLTVQDLVQDTLT